MPGRNIYKQYSKDNYYHVYIRGNNKRTIFLDKQDYSVFLNLFKRYLNDQPVSDNKNRLYPNYHDQLELLCFCLMPNHVHALVYQHNNTSVTKLFQAIFTAYGMYFNKKYSRKGPVYESRFRASMITSDPYLHHISRYIHLNPKTYKTWAYSSLPYYLGQKKSSWLNTTRIMELFSSQREYEAFLTDYESHKEMLDELRYELADTTTLFPGYDPGNRDD